MATVEIPLIREAWQMTPRLRDKLYKHIFADPHSIKYDFYEAWYNGLSEEEKNEIRRLRLLKPS
jgi:hypothetical protein